MEAERLIESIIFHSNSIEYEPSPNEQYHEYDASIGEYENLRRILKLPRLDFHKSIIQTFKPTEETLKRLRYAPSHDESKICNFFLNNLWKKLL